MASSWYGRVSGSALTLRHTGELDGFGTPSGNDFVVLAGPPGAAVPVPVTAVKVVGDEVRMELARAVVAGEPVQLSYLAGAMHPLRDAAGVMASPFADLTLHNETGTDGAYRDIGRPSDPAAAGASRPRAVPQYGAVTRLDLSRQDLSDLSPLAGLAGLRELNVEGNAIVDLLPLAGLTGLERLDLSGNRVADLWALSELTGLEVLLLDDNRVAEVLPLWSLQGLVNLGLSDNGIADLTLLAELRSLKRLDLSGNRVSDASPLGDLSQLVWLRLPGNPVSDAYPLGRLTAMRWLWMDATAFEAGSDRLRVFRSSGAPPVER